MTVIGNNSSTLIPPLLNQNLKASFYFLLIRFQDNCFNDNPASLNNPHTLVAAIKVKVDEQNPT
jgi:hypothetical protein